MRARKFSPLVLPFVAMGAVIVVAVLFAGRSQKGIAVGWCCLQARSGCDAGYDAILCRDSGGIAYSTAESACSQACSLSVADAAQTR